MQSQSLSPTKRPTFRSKTKLPTPQLPQPRTIPSYKMYLKQFPLGLNQDILKIIETFQPIHSQFLQNLDSLKLYKVQLAGLFEENWGLFMDILKAIVVKMGRRADKMVEEKQMQVVALLNINTQAERELQRIREKIQQIQHVRQIQKAELQVAHSEVDSLNKEMTDIYDILRADMGKIMKYLTTVEQNKEKEIKEDTLKMYSSLQSFNTLMNSIEKQHKGAEQTLSTMRQMIKAMARNTKSTTGTQVDESELETKAANMFKNPQTFEALSYQSLDASSINTLQKTTHPHVLDKLKQKQKDQTHEPYHPKKNIQKPWALTPTLLIFLQNMSKQNEAGRVLPWQYMKQQIHGIYEQRIASQQEMSSAMVGNAMLFDEFVVYTFLKRFKIRRLAEVKLLEFVISLKYYAKFWLKAETFCILLDVMRFIPMYDQTDMYPYRADYYTQNYFFQLYRAMSSFDLLHEEDGTVYVPTKKVKLLVKGMLFFTDEVSRSRVLVKLEKETRILNKVEHADFDFSIMLFMEEFFAVRRRNSAQIGKSFAKITQKVEGYFSIDEILGIFNQFSKVYTAAEKFPQKYPVQSQLQIAKLYLYAITSGKNNYEISSAHFVQACQRYGFDSPYPFMHNCSKQRKPQKQEPNQPVPSSHQQPTAITPPQSSLSPSPTLQLVPQQTSSSPSPSSLNQQRIDIASKLFSQHFSLLRQLKDYVTIFATTLASQKDPEVLWKSFHQIRVILEKGCQFLKYPLVKN